MSRKTVLLLIFFLNMLTWVAVRELNTVLSPFGVHLHMEVLLVVFPVIFLRTLPGFALSIGASLIVGATRPPPMEHAVFLFMALWVIGMWARRHVRRDNGWHMVAFASGAQSAVLLLAGIFYFSQGLSAGAYVQRLLMDLLASALALALFVPLWIRFHVQMLTALGWRIENESNDD